MSSHGVLAVGSGTILISLVKAWYASGLSGIDVLITNAQSTDEEELKRVPEQALIGDSEALPNIIAAAEDNEAGWAAAVRPFSFIMYVAQHGDPEELQKLQAACRAEKKPLLPAMLVRGMGMAGPLLHPEGNGSWASAWRRVHASVFPADWETRSVSATASDLLANLIVNEWRNLGTNETEEMEETEETEETDEAEDTAERGANCSDQCYLLHSVTLEGSWHPILPHPLESGHEPVRSAMDAELTLGTDQEPDPEEWFSWFSSLTSEASGIFHAWDEGALSQLPLAQCLVEPADPLSEGPAKLLPTIVGSGLTHAEARRESGLAGLEAYTARMAPLLLPGLPSSRREDIHIGAGFTFAEAVGRGLKACLNKELGRRVHGHVQILTRMEGTRIEDVHCRYYLQALDILEGEPLIASGEPLLGFPAVWVRSGTSWYGSVGLHLTLALRQSLQNALMKTESTPVSSVTWHDHKQPGVIIPSGNAIELAPCIRLAVQTLKLHRKRLEVFDMRYESFLRDGPIAVVGLVLREEESL